MGCSSEEEQWLQGMLIALALVEISRCLVEAAASTDSLVATVG